MSQMKASYFVEAALEASIYVQPRDPGLTLDELNSIGARFTLRPGAIGDAVRGESDMVERPIRNRVRLKSSPAGFLFNIHVRPEGDRRNERVYEAIAHHIREHFAEHGKDFTELSREQVSRLDADTHAIDVELALMELTGLVKLTAATITVLPMGVNYFRDFEGVGQRPPWHQRRPAIREIYAEVEKAIRLRPHTPTSSAVPSGAVSKTRSVSGGVPVKRIFVSHATQNKAVANKFVKLILEGGIGVPNDAIFFSSRPGSIPAGQYFIPYIREHLHGAGLVISLITPQYRTRPFCLAELGAAWAFVENGHIPILHNVKHSEMDGVLNGMQAHKLSERTDLNELRAQVASALNLREKPLNQWEEDRDDFLKRLPEFEAKDAEDSAKSHE